MGQKELRWLFSLYLGVALALLLVGFTLFSLRAVHTAQGQAFEQQILTTSTIAAALEREFDHVASDVLSFFPRAPSPSAASDDLLSLQHHLATLENLGYFQVSSVRLVDRDAVTLAAAPPDTPTTSGTLPAPEVVRLALSNSVTVVVDSRHAPTGQLPFAAVVVPLQAAPGAVDGVALVVDTVGVAIMEPFASTRENAEEQTVDPEHRAGVYELEVLRADGSVLASSSADSQLGTTSYHYDMMKDFFQERSSGAIVHRPGGGHTAHIAAIVPVGDTPFFLVTEEPLGLLLDWPQQLRTQAIVLGGTAILIILALAWVVGQQLVRPLIALRWATEGIREGALHTPIHIRARGELAQLVQEVEAMRKRLQDTVMNLDGLNKSLVDQVQERTSQLRSVVGRLMQTQEEERRRVARDLHDETAQGLTALGVILDEAASKAQHGGDETLEAIGLARRQVNRLIADTRRLAYALRPSVLDDAGLVPALRWCSEAYLEPSGVQVSLEVSSAELRFPEPVEVALFRVGQEAMSNIARHAQASHARIALEQHGGWITLTIEDDGIGFDATLPPERGWTPQSKGFGLAGMKERVDLLGGRLHVTSRPGGGTTVTAYVPTGRWDPTGRSDQEAT